MAAKVLLCLSAIIYGASSIPLSDFYRFGLSEGDSIVGRTLDGSSDEIILNQTIRFFNGSYNSSFVNNNGIISFDSAFSLFDPELFPTSSTPLIAPFWADSDTRLNGTVWYGEKSDDEFLLNRAQEEIQRYFPSQQDFQPDFLFVATWDKVPHHNQRRKTNTYQCILVSNGVNSFTLFYYADGMIEWTTGDDSGGVDGLGGNPAHVGYDAADGVHYYNIPASGTDSIINIASTSNVGVGGVWAFRLDEEETPVIRCSDRTPVTIQPHYGNLFGGTGVFIHVCQGIRERSSVQCHFGNERVFGKRLSKTVAVCVSPPLSRSGSVVLEVQIGGKTIISTYFLALSPENSHSVTISNHEGLLFHPSDEVTLEWSPKLFTTPSINEDVANDTVNLVDVGIYVLNNIYTTNRYIITRIQEMKKRANDGQTTIKMNEMAFLRCTTFDVSLFLKICPILFKISVNGIYDLPEEMGVWSGVAFFKPNSSTTDEELAEQCQEWSDNPRNTAITPLLATLPSCPPTLPLAIFDINFQQENMISRVTRREEYEKSFMRYFHPDVSVCYRQNIPLREGPGQQCCYGSDSILIKKYTGGSADVESPLRSYYHHVVDDLLPYILCCKGDYNICEKYYSARPEGDEDGYILPVPACVYGDPHIVTLDGHKYTFNGKGEFILIQTSSNVFALQGRMEQLTNPDGSLSPGTVFTAIVAKQISSNTSVQFEVSKNEDSLNVLVDGEKESFDGVSIIEYENVILLDKDNNTVQALFSSGANIEISVLNGIINVMLVALPSSMKQTTSGLMGSFNDIISDDFKPRSGGGVLQLDDNLENIHKKFGITWIIHNESESLFTYKDGESWSTYYSPNFLPMFAPTFTNSTLQKEAEKVCGKDQFCLFDIAATKRVEIGTATMEGQEMLDTIIEMSKPIVCSPLCENGVCLENNTCRCNDGFQGDRCSEAVLEKCSFNPCQNNGTCSKLSVTLLCECPSEYTGSFCQNKVPPFSIQMLNGSPRVLGNDVQIEFSPSKPAVSRCTLDGHNQDCSNGIVRYSNLASGLHHFRIISRTTNKERRTLQRRIFIGPCSVHLINEGLSINDRDVTIEFSVSSDVPVFHCRLDRSRIYTNCKSPLRLRGLEAGKHKVVLQPRKCAKKGQGSLSVNFVV